MNGQFEQSEFTDVLLAGTGKTPISISCSVLLDENSTLPSGKIKPVWCVSFLMVGSGFSITKTLQIGSTPGSKKKAEDIVDSINKWYNGYNTLKEALKLCLPDSCEDSSLEDWQKDTINQARKIVEE